LPQEAHVRQKKIGHLEAAGTGLVKLTDAGIKKAGGLDDAASTVRSNLDYQAHIKGMLTKPKSPQIFEILCDGQAYTQHQLAGAIGVSHPNVHSFFYGFQELRRKNLVERAGAAGRMKLFRLVDRLFPEGRPDVVAETPPRKKAKMTHSKKKVNDEEKETEPETEISEEPSAQEEWEVDKNKVEEGEVVAETGSGA